jgi:hypothetical protein
MAATKARKKAIKKAPKVAGAGFPSETKKKKKSA